MFALLTISGCRSNPEPTCFDCCPADYAGPEVLESINGGRFTLKPIDSPLALESQAAIMEAPDGITRQVNMRFATDPDPDSGLSLEQAVHDALSAGSTINVIGDYSHVLASCGISAGEHLVLDVTALDTP
jgi:hypothetical protein